MPVILPSKASKEDLRSVRELLIEVDGDFVPPLSSRTDTMSLQRDDRTEVKFGLSFYFDAMLTEHWIIATDKSSTVGLVSFQRREHVAAIPEWGPSLYATTVAVAHRARGTGVASALYEELDRVARRWRVPHLTTRTWSTNEGHNHILRRQGFAPVKHIENDRGPGIDTIYFARALHEV